MGVKKSKLSPLANFVLNTSGKKKARIYAGVIDKCIDRQNKVISQAGK